MRELHEVEVVIVVEGTQEMFAICRTLLEQSRKVEVRLLTGTLGKARSMRDAGITERPTGEDLRFRPWTISLIAIQP